MRDTRGFTLIEVLGALVVLGLVVLGTQAMMTDGFFRDVTVRDLRTSAVHTAMDRIQEVQQDPSYATLAARYHGVEHDVGGVAGLERETVVTHVRSQGVDFKRVTVRVSGTGLARPVVRTATLAAP